MTFDVDAMAPQQTRELKHRPRIEQLAQQSKPARLNDHLVPCARREPGRRLAVEEQHELAVTEPGELLDEMKRHAFHARALRDQ